MIEELVKLIGAFDEAEDALTDAVFSDKDIEEAVMSRREAAYMLARYISKNRHAVSATSSIQAVAELPDVVAKRYAVERAREHGGSVNYIVRFFDDGDEAALWAISQTWMPGLYYRIWDFEADCCIWDGRKLQREGWKQSE